MKEIDENKKRIIKISIYLFLIILIIIFARFSNKSNNKPQEEKKENIEIINVLKNIEESHFKANIHLILDDDALTLEYERINEIEIGKKKYHKEETEYIKKDNIFYSIVDDKIEKLNNFKTEEYDLTFTELSVINELINLSLQNKTYTLNEDSLSLDITSKDALNIYNKFNNTNIEYYLDGKITINIKYKNNNLDNITIDLTDFYNSLNNQNMNKFLIELTYESIKEEDTSWIINLIP